MLSLTIPDSVLHSLKLPEKDTPERPYEAVGREII